MTQHDRQPPAQRGGRRPGWAGIRRSGPRGLGGLGGGARRSESNAEMHGSHRKGEGVNFKGSIEDKEYVVECAATAILTKFLGKIRIERNHLDQCSLTLEYVGNTRNTFLVFVFSLIL